MNKVARAGSLFINWFNGLCAVICGVWMMLSALTNLPLSWNDWMPLAIYDPMPFRDVFFTSHFWPGLALLLVNGVPNLAAAVSHMRKDETLWKRLCLAAGVLLVCWTGFEMALIPNPISVVYLVIGIVQLVFWAGMRKV